MFRKTNNNIIILIKENNKRISGHPLVVLQNMLNSKYGFKYYQANNIEKETGNVC